MPQKLSKEVRSEIMRNPLISLTFLENCMIFNNSITKKFDLPIFFDFELTSDATDVDILAISEKIREKYKDKPEYFIKREIRDTIDRIKMQK